MITIETYPKRPNWVDRQMIAASDLNAEQAWQDAQLSRLRHFALGWGVVAGLEVTHAGNSVDVAPGYGVTPTGQEVYLAKRMTVDDLFEVLIVQCCPELGGSCALPAFDNPAVEVEVEKTAWLVLRPSTVETCPRAGVTTGCAHPGNALFMSRQGATMTLELVCDLEGDYMAGDLPCDALQAMMEGEQVALPDPLDSILPIAAVRYDRSGITGVSMETRQRLLPVSVLQGALACCECSEQVIPDPEPNPDPEPDPQPPVEVWDDPLIFTLGDLVTEFEGFVPNPAQSLALTMEQIFGVSADIGFTSVPRGAKSMALLQSLAAAALVSDATGRQAFKEGKYGQIYRTALLTQGPLKPTRGLVLRGGSTTRGAVIGSKNDLRALTLGRLVKAQPSNFRLASNRLNNINVVDFMKKSAVDLFATHGKLDNGPAVAAAWMRVRLEAILTS